MRLRLDPACILAWAQVLVYLGPDIVDTASIDDNVSKPQIFHEVSDESEESWIKKCHSGRSPCISVCCHPGLYYESSTCIEQDTPANELQFPTIYNDDFQPLNRTVREFIHVHGIPCKDDASFLNPQASGDRFFFLKSGSLYIPNSYNDDEILRINEYCLASMRDANNSVTKLVICAPQRYRKKYKLLYPMTLLVFTPFLIAIIFIYTVVPELRNLHGRSLRIYITVLCMTYFALAAVDLGGFHLVKRTTLCTSIAYFVYFLHVGNSFWLNVVCFDIWWTFGGNRKILVNVVQRNCKQFLLYSIYAWGCTSVLTCICLIMDFFPTIPENFIRPEFGVSSCWFHTRAAAILYIDGPEGITIICNICLFIPSAVKIAQQERCRAKNLNTTVSQRHDNNESRDIFSSGKSRKSQGAMSDDPGGS